MTIGSERVELERGCQLELRKQKINGTAEFRKWAVKNHPDKGGKLKVFQKVSGCVDVVFKAPDTEQTPSTSYPQPRPSPSGKKFRARYTSRAPPQTDYFWSAFEEYEVDEDFLFGRPPPRRNGYSEGVRTRRARTPPEEFDPRKSRRRDRAYEKKYGFRGDPNGFTTGDWDEFEEYVREHFDAREKRERAAEERRHERRKEKRNERERQKKSEEESRKWRGTSPHEWTGPSNPYQDPDSSEAARARARAAREQGARAPWNSRQWAKDAAQRMKRAFHSQKWRAQSGERGNWRHRLSRPQVAFMVAQLTCMQSVFLSTTFRTL